MLSLALFVTRGVVVKMLPYDNKPEFDLAVDLPAGTALPITADVTRAMVDVLRKLPEVTAVQIYAGTPAPIDFNGMARHYYLRNQPWQAQLQCSWWTSTSSAAPAMRSSSRCARCSSPSPSNTRPATRLPRCPRGLRSCKPRVADVYGRDQANIRTVADHLDKVLEATPGVADVNASMQRLYQVQRFRVDANKAEQRGVSVRDILRNLSLAMGSEHSGDIKQGATLEPTRIVIGVPYGDRADPEKLADLPIPSSLGGSVPLSELGRFEQMSQEAAIYHKDLRSLEYVVGDAIGCLDSPIYPMMEVEAALDDYRTPDGAALSGTLTGPPPANDHSAFEWGGEWIVTYETFRDLGLAFAAGLLMIYSLLIKGIPRLSHSAHHHGPHPFDAARHRARAPADGGGIYRYLDDWLHRSGGHHRA